MPIVQANGVSLHYELQGEGGDPIVLIHGAWFDRHNWDSVVPEFSRSFRVLNYDRRGHGHSGAVAGRGSATEDAADASALLTRTGLAPAHVVGQSTGGIVALRLAMEHPRVVRSLSVHEPPLLGLLADDPSFAPIIAEEMARRNAVLGVLEKGDREGGARLFVETQMAGPGGWDKLPRPIRETFIANADNYLDEMRNPVDATIDLEALGHFPGPALLSCGGTSKPLMKRIVEKLATAMPASRVHTFAGAGHNAHITHPKEFARTISAFVNSLEGARTAEPGP